MNELQIATLYSLVLQKIYEYITEGVPVYFDDDGSVGKYKPMCARDLAAMSKVVLDMQLRDDELQREARKVSTDTVIPFPATPSSV